MSQRFRFMHFVPCLAVLVLAGCGAGTGSVSGKVTYKNQALSGGTVTFLTSDQKVKTGFIGKDGSYSIEGVTAGPIKISVSPLVAIPKMPMGMKMDPSKMGGAPADAGAPPADAKAMSLPQKYQDPEQSGLTYTVIKGQQQYNIEMK